MGRINDDIGVFVLIFAATNLTLLTFQSISLVISAGVAMHRLFIVCILLISTLFSSAGLFIPISQLPGFLRWTRHINPMKYSNDLVSGERNSWYSSQPPPE
jgi:ABC-type multidrug transport system permease subunit|eukprot:COSAG02_NODE_39119_length_420_cov_71.510597_1_plen_101_part_00